MMAPIWVLSLLFVTNAHSDVTILPSSPDLQVQQGQVLQVQQVLQGYDESRQSQVIEAIQASQLHPWVQKYAIAFTDPRIVRAAQKVEASPDRKNLIWAEIAWVVFMLFFRSWVYSRVKNWFQKIFAWLGTWLVYFTGSSICVPVIVMGAPYSELIKLIVQAIARVR